MYFDALTTGALRDELRATLLGGGVERVFLTSELSVGFEFWAPPTSGYPRRKWLFVSAEAQHPRVHLASERLTKETDRTSPLLLLLRKYARHGRLTAVEQPELERMLILNFARRHDDGEHLEVSFIVEIMGRLSNLILVNPEGMVLDAAKRVTSEINRYRTVLPAQPYVPPPPQAGKLNPLSPIDLIDLPAAARTAAPGKPLPPGLVGALRGVSPLLAREIAWRGTGRTDPPVESLTPDDWRGVERALRDLFAPLATGEWEPTVARDAECTVVAYAPYRLTHLAGTHTVEPTEGISAALDAFYSARDTIKPWSAARAALRTQIEEHRERAARKLEALRRSLVPAEELERLRVSGEWVLGLASTIRPGQAELAVEEVGLRIRLDPALSPVENAQAYFKEYGKAKSAQAGVPELIEQTEATVDYLGAALALLETAPGLAEIEEIRHDMAAAGFPLGDLPGAPKLKLKEPKVKPGRRGRPQAPKRPRMLPIGRAQTSTDGFEILVGRSGRQNEEVTFGRGVGDDLWLHARGVPGAHVLVKARGRDIPERTIREAAALAAYHSQSRLAGSVPVDYTLQKYVRRIKGAPPGMVSYTHEHTVHVEPRAPAGKAGATSASGAAGASPG